MRDELTRLEDSEQFGAGDRVAPISKRARRNTEGRETVLWHANDRPRTTSEQGRARIWAPRTIGEENVEIRPKLVITEGVHGLGRSRAGTVGGNRGDASGPKGSKGPLTNVIRSKFGKVLAFAKCLGIKLILDRWCIC